MTISSTINRKEYTGNGATTSFSFPYYVLAAADLKVYQNGTLKTLTTHYTLSGSAPYDSGTNVQFVTAPAADDEIVILRDPFATQSLDLVENDPLPAEELEKAYDRLTMLIQRLIERADRSFRFPDTDVSGASLELPSPSAGMVVGWNAAGDGLENKASAGAVSVSEFIETLLDDADAAAARATLGAAALASPIFTDTPAAPTAAVDTNTTQLATTGFVIAQAGSATPLVDAAAAVVGTSTRFARADHVHPQRNIASGTATATTSGTLVDFSNIPSWAKKITVILSGVSTSGVSPVLVQIGDSGGIETTSYASTYCSIDSSATLYTEGSTTGFIIPGIPAVAIRSGILTLTLIDSSTNTWVASGSFKTSTTVAGYTGGDKSLSATLDRVRITTSNGTDTFDAGKVNIFYE